VAHSRKDWAALKAAYRRGEGSLEKLAARFGFSLSSVEKRSAREKWSVQRKIVGQKAEKKARERDVESVAAMLGKHRRFASRLLQLANKRLDEGEASGRGVSGSALDKLAQVFVRAARQERLAAGIEPARPVMAFEAAGAGTVLRVLRRRNAQVPEPPRPPPEVA
jgi:hypothetical protein